MAPEGHLRSILSCDRTALEFLLLLSAGWDGTDLRPKRLAARRVALIDTSGDEELGLAVRIAAHAASVEVFPVPAALGSEPARVAETLGTIMDAILLSDPEGRAESLYEQDRARILNLQGPSGAPIEVIGHLHRLLVSGRSLRGLKVTWEGEPGPALRSWAEATAFLDIHVTQAGGTPVLGARQLGALRAGGARGTFTHQSESPELSDFDAREPLDLRTRACAIAAILEFSLHGT